MAEKTKKKNSPKADKPAPKASKENSTTKVVKDTKKIASKSDKSTAKATKSDPKASGGSKKGKSTSKSTSKKTAVLQINNMQYVVKEGETIETRIALDSKKDDVEVKLLAIIDDKDAIEYGTPFLDNKIDFELGEVTKGKKVTKAIYKAKSRYRRKTGHRPKFVEFSLISIN